MEMGGGGEGRERSGGKERGGKGCKPGFHDLTKYLRQTDLQRRNVSFAFPVSEASPSIGGTAVHHSRSMW